MSDQQARVCWLSGNITERSKTYSRIRESLGEVETHQVSDNSSLADLENYIYSDDCFGSRRLVEIVAFPKSSMVRATYVANVKRLLDNVPAECLVLIYGVSPSAEKALFNHVSKIGKVFEYSSTVSIHDLPLEISRSLSQRKKTIDPEVAQIIADSIVSEDGKVVDLDCLDLAMDKLSIYLGNRRKVEESDARSVFPPSNRTTVWELFNAIDSNNLNLAFALRAKLLSYETNGDEVELAIRMMYVFLWRYKLMLFVNEAQANGMKSDEITIRARMLLKLEFDGQFLSMVAKSDSKALYSDKFIDMIVGDGIRRTPRDGYSRKRMLRLVDFVNDCLSEIRANASPAKCGLMVDMLILKSCDQLEECRQDKLWNIFGHEHVCY